PPSIAAGQRSTTTPSGRTIVYISAVAGVGSSKVEPHVSVARLPPPWNQTGSSVQSSPFTVVVGGADSGRAAGAAAAGVTSSPASSALPVSAARARPGAPVVPKIFIDCPPK